MTSERHTVIETPDFIAAAKSILSNDERNELISHLSTHPMAGKAMRGTGGARKLRWAAKGKGKSGGARVVYFYSGAKVPVFLLDIYGKNEKDNLTKAETKLLKGILSELVSSYQKQERNTP